MELNDIKISCSDIVSIMGTSYSGLSDIQKEQVKKLQSKVKRTIKQQDVLDWMLNKRDFIPDLKLSDTCKSLLINTYCRVFKGKNKSSFSGLISAAMKGTFQQQQALGMVIQNTDRNYCVDDRLISNDFIMGKVDGFTGGVFRECRNDH